MDRIVYTFMKYGLGPPLSPTVGVGAEAYLPCSHKLSDKTQENKKERLSIYVYLVRELSRDTPKRFLDIARKGHRY